MFPNAECDSGEWGHTDRHIAEKTVGTCLQAGCLAGGPDFELLMMPFICRDLEGERGENEHRRSTNPTKRR